MRQRHISPIRLNKVTRVSLHAAGVPERYWLVSLSQMQESESQKKLVGYLQTVHAQIEKGQGLFIYGGFETGKTSAAVAIIKEVLRRGGSSYLMRSRHLLRAIYDNEETPDGLELIRHRMQKVDLLVLDDLGAEGFDSKKGGGAELEGVFRDRYDRSLPIIVTSNYSPDKLKPVYTEAIVNIIRRTVAVVKMDSKQWIGGEK